MELKEREIGTLPTGAAFQDTVLESPLTRQDAAVPVRSKEIRYEPGEITESNVIDSNESTAPPTVPVSTELTAVPASAEKVQSRYFPLENSRYTPKTPLLTSACNGSTKVGVIEREELTPEMGASLNEAKKFPVEVLIFPFAKFPTGAVPWSRAKLEIESTIGEALNSNERIPGG